MNAQRPRPDALALLAAMPAHARQRTSVENITDVLTVIAPPPGCTGCGEPVSMPTCDACTETLADSELDDVKRCATRMANALQEVFNTVGAIAEVRRAYESVAGDIAEYKGLPA